MADYKAYARSSYFKVKNPKAFEAFCNKWGISIITKDVDGETLHGFLCQEGMPTSYWDGKVKELSKHLDPDWVAVFQEIGSENLRYLVGYSCLVDSMGNITTTNINSIYSQVEGRRFTDCSY